VKTPEQKRPVSHLGSITGREGWLAPAAYDLRVEGHAEAQPILDTGKQRG